MERMKMGGVSSNYQSIVIGKNAGSLPMRPRSFLKRPGRGSETPSAQANQPQIDEEEVDMELFEPLKCAVKFHEPRASSAPVLLEGKAALGIRPGTIGELETLEGVPRKLMFVVKYVEDEIPTSKVNTSANANQGQVSIQTGSLQELLMLKRGSPVLVRLRKRKDAEADVVELRIKDVHLSRGDMWCLSSTLAGNCVYKHEKKSFIDNSIRTSVSKIYVEGRSVFSAYVGQNTRVVFRSESVKLVILIQISSEMWDFEETGQQMFNKLINSLFPKVFNKWTELGAHHLITIVLFSSIDLANKSWSLLGPGDRPSDRKDYYRVVVDQVSILLWSEIMSALRFEFANFMKDIMLRENKASCKTDRDEEYVIQGRFLPAVKGNLIEAINLATTLVTDHFRDPELRYTSNHFILISPGTGIYDVDYNLMAHTSKKMAKVDAAIDVICLSQPPLHVVPLFRYKESNSKVRHCIPTWLDVSFWNDSSQYINQWMPRCKIYEIQMMGVVENELKTISLPNLRINPNSKSINEVIDKYDENVFRPVSPCSSEERKVPTHLSPEILQLPKKNSPSTETFKINQIKESQPSTIDVKALGTTNSRLGISARSSLLNFINDDSKSGIANFIRDRISSLPSSFIGVKGGEFDKEDQSKSHTVGPISTVSRTNDIPESKNIPTPKGLEKVVKKAENASQSPPSLTRTNSSVSVTEDSSSQKDDKLSPYWTTVQNPSKALTSELLKMIGYGRWQHVFPSKVKRRAVKWASLSTPAALPITTQIFPKLSDFESNFTFQIYDVILNNNDMKMDTGDLIREMIYLRLVLGFQICTGEKVDVVESRRKPGGDPNLLIKYLDKRNYHGSRIYMILEDEIHRISCDYHGKVNVQLYRRSNKDINVKAEDVGSYFSNIRTRYDDLYRPSVVDCFKNEIKSYNWNQLDQILAGYFESVDEDQKYYHKMKFVVLPAGIPEKSYAFQLNENKERLSPEELRLEGLRKLIATIHKGRHLTEKEKKKQAKKEEILPEINFYTGDLFAFLSKQSEVYDPDKPHKNSLLVESLGLNTNIPMKQLAHYLQSKDGIDLADRKWHFRIHRHCFVGLELVSWMIENLNDIDSREEAERYGNKLMNNGLFVHVEKRHSFLDGHYFYRLNSEYVEKVEPGNNSSTPRESRSSSVTDSFNVKSPMLSPQTTREPNTTSDSPLRQVTSKTADGAPKRFMLSRFVIYDVDQQKKSYRRELIKVHYDRVHNPEHCFHIRLEWLNTTTKLIEDTVNSWTRLCERYGLKFVETPWAELCSMPEKNPFHSFVTIRLALNPWTEKELAPENNSPLDENKFFYHLYLLDKSDFMLDNRTTIFFTKVEMNVAYSWGRPEFKFAQFIHKTGAYIAEIRDNGDLFLAPNNTHVARVNMDISNNNLYQQQSNYGTYLDSQRVMLEFQSTCGDAEKLRRLFNEARVKWEESRDIDQAIFGS